MSYCRFENTAGDLRDCVGAMEEVESVEELDLNDYEVSAYHRMKTLCEEFLVEYKRINAPMPCEE
jgi:hypothetical protein